MGACISWIKLKSVKTMQRFCVTEDDGLETLTAFDSLIGSDDDSHSVKIPDDNPHKIDCGLKRIETERYQRDYYINRSPVPAQRSKANAPKPMPRKRNFATNMNDVQGYASNAEAEAPGPDGVGDKLNMVEEKVRLRHKLIQ